MRKFLSLIIIVALFTGCTESKRYNPKPASDDKGDQSETTNPPTDTNPPSTTNPVTNSPFTVKLDIAPQIVNTAVGHDTLFLVYTEKADLIVNKEEYESSSAVHFKEDFSKSSLANFHYAALNGNGDYVTDYVDDNLNNVKIKTAASVDVDGKAMVKLTLERVFIFFKAYKQRPLAVEAQTNILKADRDSITFSSYIYDKKNYVTTKTTLPLSYVKVD